LPGVDLKHYGRVLLNHGDELEPREGDGLDQVALVGLVAELHHDGLQNEGRVNAHADVRDVADGGQGRRANGDVGDPGIDDDSGRGGRSAGDNVCGPGDDSSLRATPRTRFPVGPDLVPAV